MICIISSLTMCTYIHIINLCLSLWYLVSFIDHLPLYQMQTKHVVLLAL